MTRYHHQHSRGEQGNPVNPHTRRRSTVKASRRERCRKRRPVRHDSQPEMPLEERATPPFPGAEAKRQPAMVATNAKHRTGPNVADGHGPPAARLV